MTEVSEALTVLAGAGAPSPKFEAANVEGSWELVFSTQLKSGYMPVREIVGFFPSREEATIDTTAGLLPLGGIRGQCWWKGGPENELEFSLTEVRLGPFKFSKSKDQVKTYKFFANDQKVMAARSSAGGFALFSRASCEEEG
ncbi:unnamed protein product [Pylaiella littoralis]